MKTTAKKITQSGRPDCLGNDSIKHCEDGDVLVLDIYRPADRCWYSQQTGKRGGIIDGMWIASESN